MRTRLQIIAISAVALVGLPATSSGDKPDRVSNSLIYADVAGRRIRIDKLTSQSNQNRCAIIVLHGAGGTLFDGPEMRRIARSLAIAGNTVYIVHYFDRTGTIFGLDAGMQKNFEVWLETINRSIRRVQADHGDAAPVGIYGYSLGAFLALAAASDNSAVGAVVEQAGGIWNNNAERIHHMPPVLVLHGEGDQRVPLDKYAHPLERVLRARGTDIERRFFANEGHVFRQQAMDEVRPATAVFFHKHLARNKREEHG